jgi:hypothetical protein
MWFAEVTLEARKKRVIITRMYNGMKKKKKKKKINTDVSTGALHGSVSGFHLVGE